MTDLAESLTAAIRSAPELVHAPELAVSAIQTGVDGPGAGEASAYAMNAAAQRKALGEHVQRHGSGPLSAALSWITGGVHDAEHLASSALHASGAPLREVQHEYRALRDIGERHGPLAALGVSVAIGAGTTGGALAGGEKGAALGGEAVAGIVGRLFPDSWARTSDGEHYRDPSSGQLVSPGRDLAHVLHVKEGTWTSGVADGLFDVLLDPLGLGGGMAGEARSAEGASGLLKARYGGTALNTVDDVERVAYQYGSARRAFREIASLSPGEIVSRYPKFANLAEQLGEASTPSKVVDVFRDAVAADQLTRSSIAPMLRFTKVPFAAIARAESEGSALGRVADRMSRPFTLVPSAWDDKLLRFSNTEFNPNDSSGLEGIYRVVRMGQSRRVAEDVVSRFSAAQSIGERADIYRNSVANMLAAKAGEVGYDELANPAHLKQIAGRLDEILNLGGGKEAVYGLNEEGRNLSRVVTDGGKSVTAAITENQVGKWAFPDYTAVKRVASEMAGHRSLFGQADDFLYDRWTAGVFKKLVLLSGGFALRISAAEAIPAGLREGFGNLVKSSVEANVAKLGVKADADELGHIGAAVYALLGRPAKAVASEDVDLATALVQANGGHVVAPGVQAGEHVSGEVVAPVEKARRDLRHARLQTPQKVRGGDDFATFGHENSRYVDYWHRWVGEVARDPKTQAAAAAYRGALSGGEDAARTAAVDAARQWLDAQPEEYLRQFTRHHFPSTPGVDPHEDWARVTVDNLLGATGKHDDLLAAVAAGEAPKRAVLDAIPDELRPANVKGRIMLPDTSGTLDRVANVGFRKVLDPIVNFLSREPLYFQEVKNQFAPLRKLVDDGVLDYDTALARAQTRAVNHMLPHIHNVGERSQAAATLRNLAPFYFAQTQAYRRVGRLLAEDPGAFRRYQLIFSSLADVGHKANDENGTPHLILPGTGFVATHVPGVLKMVGLPLIGSSPVAMSGDLKSLATVSPFLENEPGTGIGVGPFRAHFGPVVGVAAHALTSLLPETGPTASLVIGERQASGTLWDQLIPNQTLKRVVQAFGPESATSFHNAALSTIQSLAARGQAPGPEAGPRERQRFLDRVRNQTRVLFLLKALVGAVSPASPQLEVGDWQLQDEFRQDIAKHGVAEGADTFLAKHPDATPYTVFKSEVVTGAPLPASKVAEQFINDHSALFDKYPYAVAWFVPQADATFDQATYNEQVAQALRVRKAPKEMLDDIYAAAGYIKYDQAKKERDAEIAKHPDQEQSIRHAFSGYLQTILGPQNPVWWADLQSPERQQQKAIAVAQLRQVFTDGAAPNTDQARAVQSLLADWDEYQAMRIHGASDPASAARNRALAEQWSGYLASVVARRPELAAIANKLFDET